MDLTRSDYSRPSKMHVRQGTHFKKGESSLKLVASCSDYNPTREKALALAQKEILRISWQGYSTAHREKGNTWHYYWDNFHYYTSCLRSDLSKILFFFLRLRLESSHHYFLILDRALPARAHAAV